MKATTYEDINSLLVVLSSHMQAILGDNLVGLYLYGSLVWGDFDYEISDIDLLAATTTDIDENEFSQLDIMHQKFVADQPTWNDRIEIAYLSLRALRTFKTERSLIGIISPGEPFHRKEAGKDWLLNWYFVQEKGVTLFGPSPSTIIEPISKSEYIEAVREQARFWRDYLIHTKHSRPYQSYAILTICRAWYALENGEQVSKKRAAQWAEEQMPQEAALIQNALKWRAEALNKALVVDDEATYPEIVRFVNLIIDHILKSY